jgi:hypothetical protein
VSSCTGSGAREAVVSCFYLDLAEADIAQLLGCRPGTVRGAVYRDRGEGDDRVVLVSGAQVLVERERFHDSYALFGIAQRQPGLVTARGGMLDA